MNAVAGRRLAVAAAALLAVGALVPAGSVHAATGNLAYSCTLPVIGSSTFLIDQSTGARPVYLGTTLTPTLTTKAQVPADKVELMAGALKATYVDGTITTSVQANGSPLAVVQKIARKAIPADGPLVLVATGPLKKLAPTAPGSVTYLPGDLKITMRFYTSADDTKPEEFKDLPCSMPSTRKTIDTIAFTRSPTKVAPTATYSKSKKKVTASVKVTATSKLVPAGKVTAVLYKGSKKVKSVSATLKAGKATATFKGVSKAGSYKVVVSYGGSPLANPSKGSKSFTIR